ncbi:MAG: amino acid ABC transporter ATP-binding protein [Clostridia bacterium]|nr:amino acid ABC transporter ATP-binding protein [Clostridia bacterium]
MAFFEVKHFGKSFGDTEVLKDINFTMEKGEVLAIIGSSGSGKTTLLRCINFLETPNQGTMTLNGKLLLDAADPETMKKKVK